MQTSRPRSKRDNLTNKQKLPVRTRNDQSLLANPPQTEAFLHRPQRLHPSRMCRGRFFFPRGEFSHNSSMADERGA